MEETRAKVLDLWLACISEGRKPVAKDISELLSINTASVTRHLKGLDVSGHLRRVGHGHYIPDAMRLSDRYDILYAGRTHCPYCNSRRTLQTDKKHYPHYMGCLNCLKGFSIEPHKSAYPKTYRDKIVQEYMNKKTTYVELSNKYGPHIKTIENRVKKHKV